VIVREYDDAALADGNEPISSFRNTHQDFASGGLGLRSRLIQWIRNTGAISQ
jgi:hypothetical protein